MKINEFLNLPMSVNNPGSFTIREYFKFLLLNLWDEKEGFSGKRPFGNSGWEYELYATLIKNNIILGELDDFGQVQTLNKENEQKADQLIFDVISNLYSLDYEVNI